MVVRVSSQFGLVYAPVLESWGSRWEMCRRGLEWAAGTGPCAWWTAVLSLGKARLQVMLERRGFFQCRPSGTLHEQMIPVFRPPWPYIEKLDVVTRPTVAHKYVIKASFPEYFIWIWALFSSLAVSETLNCWRNALSLGLSIKVNVKFKFTLQQATKAQRGSRETYSFLNLSAIWVCLVNATPRPLNPRERSGTHCIGSRVGPRVGLDGYGKSRPPPGFDPAAVQPVASRYPG